MLCSAARHFSPRRKSSAAPAALAGTCRTDVDEVRQLTKRMVADARRASDIVAGIRAMATRRAPEQTLLSLDDAIREALVFLHHEVESRGVAVSHFPALVSQKVFGDCTQLQQVVVNLAVNAMQAMAQAGSTARTIIIRTAGPGSTTPPCAARSRTAVQASRLSTSHVCSTASSPQRTAAWAWACAYAARSSRRMADASRLITSPPLAVPDSSLCYLSPTRPAEPVRLALYRECDRGVSPAPDTRGHNGRRTATSSRGFQGTANPSAQEAFILTEAL